MKAGRVSPAPRGAPDVAIRAALEAVRAQCDVAERLRTDPVSFAHPFAHRDDREIAAFVAASSAFGNVRAVRAKLEDLFARIGRHPASAGEDLTALMRALEGWKHRLFRGEDMARLIFGLRSVQRTHGSLEACFRRELARARLDDVRSVHACVREALAGFCDAIRRASGLEKGGLRRGPAHLLPDVRGSSGSKRLLLFLKWVARPADGVDLGLWDVDPSILLVPIDVHLHRLGRNLGFTARADLSWQTTEEITRALAKFDPEDPTKYDFSLCHMGMLQRCPSRRDPGRCEGCGVKPVCIHWPQRGQGRQRRRVVREDASKSVKVR